LCAVAEVWYRYHLKVEFGLTEVAQVASHICLLQISLRFVLDVDLQISICQVKPVILEHPDSWSRMAWLELVVAPEMPTSRLGMVVCAGFFLNSWVFIKLGTH